MKYEAPYGVSDPNAGYINGNPSTGTMGSIPPAASIEYPQREIVALIAAAGLTPTDADLAQLLKSVKLADVMNVFKMGTNGGTASQWSMTCPVLPIMPPPTGTTVWFKPGLPSVNGGTLFSLNGSAFQPVVNADLSPIAIADILPTAWLLMFFDGTYWQIIAGSTRELGALPVLHASANWYVNDATGNDTTFDGTADTVSGAHGPFKTIQRAANEVLKYNMNGYDQTIHVADGSYAPVDLYQPNGAGVVHLFGNQGAPQNCAIFSATRITIYQRNGGVYDIAGFRLSSTGPFPSSGFASNGGIGTISNCQWGPCTASHIAVFASAVVYIAGTHTVEAGANAGNHISAGAGAQILSISGQPPIINLLGSVTFSQAFAVAQQLGSILFPYGNIIGKTNGHGPMYNATANAVINPVGSGPYPGDAPGVLTSGGQYIP